MTRCGLLQRWIAGVAILLVTICAVAHRAPGSLTTIKFNAQSGMTEVVHWLHLHDAERGVAIAAKQPELSLTRLPDRARVAIYVERRFSIVSEHKSLPLTTIGAEIAGDYLLVYQEIAGELPAEITITDEILRDVFPQQVNQVNIDDAGAVRTLIFAGDDGGHSYRFAAAAATGEAG